MNIVLSGGGLWACTSLYGSLGSCKVKEPLMWGYLNRIIQFVESFMSPDFLMTLKLNSDAFLRKMFGNEMSHNEPFSTVSYPSSSNSSQGDSYS